MAETKVPRIEVLTPEPDALRAPTHKGYHRRWVRNTEESLARYTEELGYKIVKREDGETFKRREYVLMEIPEDVWQARQEAKRQRILESRRAAALTRRVAVEADSLARAPESRGLAQRIGSVTLEGAGTE